ncbi:unannotated protein [freshwater metagenome]|uniref:Unannotated protein n=1 Tax=freshwater metagenome TaxID=449393 RepID=A0A6J7L538_9ZZZZ
MDQPAGDCRQRHRRRRQWFHRRHPRLGLHQQQRHRVRRQLHRGFRHPRHACVRHDRRHRRQRVRRRRCELGGHHRVGQVPRRERWLHLRCRARTRLPQGPQGQSGPENRGHEQFVGRRWLQYGAQRRDQPCWRPGHTLRGRGRQLVEQQRCGRLLPLEQPVHQRRHPRLRLRHRGGLDHVVRGAVELLELRGNHGRHRGSRIEHQLGLSCRRLRITQWYLHGHPACVWRDRAVCLD